MRHPKLLRSNPVFARATLALATCGLALTLSGGQVLAADDGDDTLIHEVGGLLGIDNAKSPDIDYRDRAPLVLPPKGKTALPKPQQALEKPTPAWPNDPDVLRAKKAAELAKLPVGFDPKVRPEQQDKNARLVSRIAPQDTSISPNARDCKGGGCPLTKEQADALHKGMNEMMPDKTTVAVGQEPDREWLTEPPKGYRKMTMVPGSEPATPADTSNPLMFWKKWLPN